MENNPSHVPNFSHPFVVKPDGEGNLVGDDLLIDDALAGNAAAFGELVHKYQNRLFASLSHVMDSTADAEDVVQDAFVQAFLKLASFQRKSSFYTWLYRIAHNTWISHRRRRRPVDSLERARNQTGFEPMTSGETADMRLNRDDELAVLQNALQELGDDSRQILILRELDELSYEQIAEVIDLPIGTVRSRLHRARQQLLEIMKQKLPDCFSTGEESR